MPVWLEAGIWGLVTGSALVVGAGLGYAFDLPRRLVASCMAFGSGVLVSALAFGLMDEAYAAGGLGWSALGLLAGAAVYTAASVPLAGRGARHRKRSGDVQPSERDQAGSGTAIALGSVLDGVPESLAIGLSLLGDEGVEVATVVAIFLSNVPEGLSSAAGMKRARRSAGYVFGLFGSIALVSGVAALSGYALLGGLSPAVAATVTAFAAGAVLAMIVDTMIPEAFAETHALAGLITTIGFLLAFALSRL